MVTLIDVAREAGVSKSSAARVLSRQGSASAETRERVEQAASLLGYRPNALARAMVSGSSGTIAVIIPDVANPFFSAVVRGLTDTARAAELEVLVSNTDSDPDSEARSIEILAEKQADGFVIAPVIQGHPGPILQLLEHNRPIVLLDRRVPALSSIPLVSLDHVGASRLAVDHLLDLGHERIAIVTEAAGDLTELREHEPGSSVASMRPSSQRLLGYLEALKAKRLPILPKLIIPASITTRSAADSVGTAIDSGNSFTALYCTDATLTSGAYRELSERGIEVPDQFSFIGFDDQEWTSLVRPPITVVDQPRHRLGSTTANKLLARLRHVDGNGEDVRLPARLLVRSSTARPA